MSAFKDLYDGISSRKSKPADFEPYQGGNGRIDRAVDLITSSDLDFPKSGTLLDVGGATGNLGYALRDYFDKRYTLDISTICKDPATAKGNTFIKSNTDEDGLPLDDGSVDLIVALDFIEHILDPGKFASECMRVLRPAGQILINTPNIQYWRHLTSLVVDGRFPHTSGDREVYHGGHVAFFNMQDMGSIFHAFDSHVMHTQGLPSDPPPPIWLAICGLADKAKQLSYADLIFSCRKPPL